MRARFPDVEGYIERGGTRIFYEVFGTGERTILLLPTWWIVHSRIWKAQVPYLARHFRVVTSDSRGNGRSDRPLEPATYADDALAGDALAVLDATGTERAVVVALSRAASWLLLLATEHAERMAGAVFIGPALPLTPMPPERRVYAFDARYDTDEGWARYNRHYWLKNYAGFVEFFAGQCLTDPHSTKQIEDFTAWALETTPEVLVAGEERVDTVRTAPAARELAARMHCPVVVIHGDADAVTPCERGAALAKLTGGTLVTIEGGGHLPSARDPVKVNLVLREFAERTLPDPRPRPVCWIPGRNRRKRALYISSPIGLGHAPRDLAIADELRKLRLDLEID
nr:alpha/beta hydrolase [Ktedonobacterales bacterium]